MHCYSELQITPVKKEFVDVIKDQKLKAEFNFEFR
jgi:hypothetical protein